MVATTWTIALREARERSTSRHMGWAGLVCALPVSDYDERKRGCDLRDSAGQTQVKCATDASDGVLAYSLIIAHGVGFFAAAHLRFTRDEM